MLKDYSKKPRPSRFDSVSWEDFEEWLDETYKDLESLDDIN